MSIDVHEVHETLRTDGVALLPGVASAALVGSLRAALAGLRAEAHPMSRQVLYVDGPEPPDRPPLTALMDQWLSPHRVEGPGSTARAASALRPLIEELLPGAVLFQDLMLVKQPGQKPFPWHQDYPYWPVDQPEGLVVWLPLTPTDSDSGALRFARGSHRLGPRPVVDLHDGRPQDAASDLGFDAADYEWLVPRYEVGDAVVFLPTTFHGSPATKRNGERAAWSSIWLDPSCRWSHTNAPNHPLCRVVEDGAPVGSISLAGSANR